MRKYIIGALIGIASIGLVNAERQEFDLGYDEEVTVGAFNTYSVELQSNSNFITNDEYRVFQVKSTDTYPRMLTYFWSNTGLYFISSCEGGYECQNIHTSIKAQGFFTQCGISTLSQIDFNDLSKRPTRAGTQITECIIEDYANPDKLYFNGTTSYQNAYFCFGYTQQDKMVCYNNNDALNEHLGNSLGFTYNPFISEMGSTFDEIQRYVTASPFTQGNITNQANTQGLCMTVEEIFKQQSNNYNTGLCYGNTRMRVGSGRQTTYPIPNLVTVYENYSEFREDINTYTNYCTPPATMEACQEAFSGKEYNYTIVSKIPATTTPTVLRDYCNTWQTRSGNLQKNVCDMTEEEQRNLVTSIQTPEGYAEAILNSDIQTVIAASGTVYDDLTDTTKRDIITAIPSVRTKISSIFAGRSGKTGIIPDYITWLILMIALFRLFEK